MKQLYEFGCDGDGVLGDHCVRAETTPSRYSEIQTRLDQAFIITILFHTHTYATDLFIRLNHSVSDSA